MSMRKLIAAAALLALCVGGVRRNRPTSASRSRPEDLAAWDISIGPDGAGLPPGSGTAKQGEAVFTAKCQACHGAKGAGQPNDRLVGGQGSLPGDKPAIKTVGSYWPYATTLFDYMRRAMPLQRVEVAQPRRDLCGRRLHPQSQRRHRRHRRHQCADAAQRENAQPRRLHPVSSRGVGIQTRDLMRGIDPRMRRISLWGAVDRHSLSGSGSAAAVV